MPHPVIAREGWTRILLAIAVAMLVHAVAGLWVALPFWIVALLVLQFFRDPPRAIPDLPGAIVSPAHGRVVAIQPSVDPFSGEACTRVSIFMNIFLFIRIEFRSTGRFDRHYHQGQFLNAELEKASSQNERCAIQINQLRARCQLCPDCGTGGTSHPHIRTSWGQSQPWRALWIYPFPAQGWTSICPRIQKSWPKWEMGTVALISSPD